MPILTEQNNRARNPKKESAAGFTLVELLIVITVIAVLSSIAALNFISYRKRACNISAEGDARNAYIATQAYFNDHPDDAVSSRAELFPYGFLQTDDVNVWVGGSQSTLSVRTNHTSGDRTYAVDSEGRIR
jgi:prepilin-type N-terminal cleavage/methylation domain-containing protein